MIIDTGSVKTTSLRGLVSFDSGFVKIMLLQTNTELVNFECDERFSENFMIKLKS